MFISVKEAAELTGKSATTIYRLCNKRINTEYIRKEDNKFFIDKEYLLATYPPEEEERISEFDDEQAEMRFENVLEENQPESNDDYKEQPVVLEIENAKEEPTEMQIAEYGNTIEFEEEKTQNHFEQLFSKETIIGLTISILTLAFFVYLVYNFSK